MFGKPKTTGRVVQIPVELVDPSPYQARTVFDPEEISALAVSILQNGLLQPVSVRPTGEGRYQLIAGERRLRACRQAGLTTIPAIIASYGDQQAAALSLLENIQRSQLNPFDAARGIREVITLWGCTQAQAAKRLGLSQPALANKLRLLALTPQQEELCLKGGLTERHARAVLRLPEPQRTYALEQMVAKKMSVRKADQLVERLLDPPAPKRILPAPLVREMKIFYNSIEHAVQVMGQNGIAATTRRVEREDYVEYTIHIPLSREKTSSRP